MRKTAGRRFHRHGTLKWAGRHEKRHLAHTVGSETERAYRRGDALERRRDLMAAWASYCEPASPANVVRLRG